MVKGSYWCVFFVTIRLLLNSPFTAQAQTVVGMGTDDPNPNAVLELVPENGNQGFLAPRLTSTQRNAPSFTNRLTDADNGLLVFDTEEGQFFYWFQGAWHRGAADSQDGTGTVSFGTTWYTGTTAPNSVSADEGDFYINESTGEIYKFSNNAFSIIGSLGTSSEISNRTQDLSSVLQQSNSAANEKITDLGEPTEAKDAATKDYVDRLVGTIPTTDLDNQSLSNVLREGNDANSNKIVNLSDPENAQDAATKSYVDSRPAILDTDDQSLSEVLNEDNDADRNKIVNLDHPTNDRDAATKFYVDQKLPLIGGDDQTLSEVLGEGNDANDNKIINLADPTNDQDAATKKYVDTQVLSIPTSPTPTLPDGTIYLGNAANQPQSVTIQGDITIAADGTVTIQNASISSAKIINNAVTRDKINANVAGLGLSQAADGSLQVDVGGDVTTSGSNLSVVKLRGNEIALTAPSDNQVLQWDDGTNQWTPVTLSSAGSAGTWFSGNNNPNPDNPSEAETGDFYLREGTREVFVKDGATWNSVGYLASTSGGGGGSQQWYDGNADPNMNDPSGSGNGDYYYRTAPAGGEKVYRKQGGNWQELGGVTSTDDVQLGGSGYSYRTPWLYTGTGEPNTSAGKVGDFYYRTDDGGKMYFKKGANEWDDF